MSDTKNDLNPGLMKKAFLLFSMVLLTACSVSKYTPSKEKNKDTYIVDYVEGLIKEGKVNSHPIIVLDEFKVIYDENFRNSFNVTKDEIDSITTIEKDNARAVSDYGERAKEGVIIITTKHPLKRSDEPKVLVIVDGRKASKKEVKKIDKNDIQSITVYKGREEVRKYSKRAYDGVLIIKMKPGKELH